MSIQIRQTILAADDSDRDMNVVSGALCHRYEDKAFARIVYTESHDEVANGRARIPEEIAPGQADSYFFAQTFAPGRGDGNGCTWDSHALSGAGVS